MVAVSHKRELPCRLGDVLYEANIYDRKVVRHEVRGFYAEKDCLIILCDDMFFGGDCIAMSLMNHKSFYDWHIGRSLFFDFDEALRRIDDTSGL